MTDGDRHAGEDVREGEARSQSTAEAFRPDPAGLRRGVELLTDRAVPGALPVEMPEVGVGGVAALEALAGPVLGGARSFGTPGFFAHMDPPTPWVSWVMAMWSASLNQNLLHEDTAPVAREIERRVVGWLAPLLGMNGGHMVPGSTVANLTALWAAREAGASTVVAGPDAHISVAKSAHILGLHFRTTDWRDPGGLESAVAVITAGTTASGDIEALDAASGAAWRHVDAAWSGPLRLSPRHGHLLDGVENADSVAVSAHKWLFQPKESALVLFRDPGSAHESISFGASYLRSPNVGILGSHGASAVALMATLVAYGRTGVVAWIDRCMDLANRLAGLVDDHPDLELRSAPRSGIVCWRLRGESPEETVSRVAPEIGLSWTVIDGERWVRSVAANPMADPELVISVVAGDKPLPSVSSQA